MTRRELVHQLLLEAGGRGVTTSAFLEGGCGSRFGARVQELRNAGFIIETKRLGEGSYLYMLRLPDVDEAEPPQLFDPPPPTPANALCWDEAA